ncbi:MAG: winged helix-turn-helix domain-containing protein [Pseudomonadota bacterium]
MKEGPDIARIAALIGDPARANMLVALMQGAALTATELSREAGVTIQTASSHLAKLVEGGLIGLRRQGRHKYFRLANDEVASLIERMMGLSMHAGHLRIRVGPGDDALRYARLCYHHLAGRMGVRIYESMVRRGFLALDPGGIQLSESGRDFATGLGLDLPSLLVRKSPLCLECLDWSERKSHLAGGLGRALFAHMEQRGWIIRKPGSRIVTFTQFGISSFEKHFGDKAG